jgi:hypothetical protein
MLAITPDMRAALDPARGLVRRLAPLFDVDHPVARVRLWGGIGLISWGGATWRGVGSLASLDDVETISTSAVQAMSFALSGVDPETAQILDADVKGRKALVYLAALREDMSIVPNPILLAEATLDTQTLQISKEGVATIALVGYCGLSTMQEASSVMWSQEEQHRRFPGDSGLDLMATVASKSVQWTRT